MGHPATEPPAKQEGKRPSDADLLGYLTPTAGSTPLQSVLPPGRIRELHAEPARRVEELVRRGQADGAFRTDLPASWLVSVSTTSSEGRRPTSAAAASTRRTPHGSSSPQC
jgi:hypothetical protein